MSVRPAGQDPAGLVLPAAVPLRRDKGTARMSTGENVMTGQEPTMIEVALTFAAIIGLALVCSYFMFWHGEDAGAE